MPAVCMCVRLSSLSLSLGSGVWLPSYLLPDIPSRDRHVSLLCSSLLGSGLASYRLTYYLTSSIYRQVEIAQQHLGRGIHNVLHARVTS